ncbi:uncharacterized protein LOC114193945 isoform X2 [Vigna unguiculata]|uniref:uncharacterized protein LOC114193945 isoform X2 n=1 Tax=Vigna unguiculata TaxID=3917 RepID=UPI0010169BCE|nr:uncharacterized protein LOC114193945 isoform X2 [Vigna unguiculata]
MAARHFLLHRLRLHSFQGFTVAPPQGHRLWCSATSSPEEATENASGGTHTGCSDVEVDYPKGCVKEEKIVSDIAPVIQLAKHIIFSPRYKNGEPLSMEDERAVAKNLLIYHPDYEDKIGSGLYAITMVAGSTSPIGCALRNTLKKSTKQVQIGLLVKSLLKDGQ